MKKFNGYILAGGKSSRMGMEKGLMEFCGKPLVAHAIDTICNLVNETYIITANKEYKKFGLPLLDDKIKNVGPSGGIHAALNHNKALPSFILACDMPNINCESIKFVMDNYKEQITLIEKNGRTEPLFGIYSSDCLDQWNQLIDKRIIKLQEMITHFRLNLMQGDNYSLFDRLFINLNTLSEFETEKQKSHAS